MSTYMPKAGDISRAWYVLDADGRTLGEVAAEAATLLRGKHKPTFAPHADCGDNVIVINCEKVALKGNKMTDKVYTRYTGFPGGQRFTTPKDILQNRPTELIRKAVKGMLPKTRLGDKLINNLFIYAGPEHPHQAQQPKEIKLNEI